ncbi:MAG: glycosyltransferase [candidate division KSB1 bacterium]|nr:glycosyltransferase [candidate division KSB1 bacterium]
MQTIRILRITSTLSKGGAGAHVLAIHRAVNRIDGFASYLWCPRESVDEERVIPKLLPKSVVLFNAVRTRVLGLDSLYAPLFSSLLSKLAPRFDIIHLHHLEGYFFDLRSLYLLQEKNVVLTLHDMWPLTGRCSFSQNCEKWQTHCVSCPHTDVYPAVWIDRSAFLHEQKKRAFAALNSLKLVAISEHAAENVRYSHLKGAPLSVIPPAIDCSMLFPEERRNAQPVIGAVAVRHDFSTKGFEDLMQFILYVRDAGLPFRFRLVGRLSTDAQKQLKCLPHVDLFPFTGNLDELRRHYNAMSLLINLSRQETFGKTNIEAQACGIPVLARDIPPFRENVHFGALCGDCSPETLRRMVDSLLDRHWPREEMHAEIKRRYDLSILGERYAALYRSFFEGEIK